MYTSSTLIGGKRRTRSKFASHYAWGTNGVCECKMDVKSTWIGIEGIMFHGHLDCFQKPPLGGRPNTKPEDHGTLNAHNRWFIVILFYHVWGPAWIKIHWYSIWSRARLQMTSRYTQRSVCTLHDFGGALGWPLDTFIWALTTFWSRLLAPKTIQWRKETI
jgi:hypothetical protein